ncbi:MAG: hypothetical protein ACR2QC_03300 [Gammaproteobacteria bacterium]
MKKTSAFIFAAALLAVSPAFAADAAKTIGGLVLAGGGGYLIVDASDDADEEAAACARRNPGTVCSESAFSAAPVKSIGGIAAVVGGVALAINGLTGEDNFTRNGLAMDGLTFGYTDTGKVGLQKKWEF